MRVAVADDLEVEVVGVPAAGEHGVQLLPGLAAGGEAVHGVGGDALGGVDGGGVAEIGRACDVVGWQPDGQLAAVCRTVRSPRRPMCGDGPPVAVLDPVGRGESQPAVVAAGDDHIPDAGLVPVGQTHLGCRAVGVIKTMRPGRLVESATRSRVGASMSASSPAARSDARR